MSEEAFETMEALKTYAVGGGALLWAGIQSHLPTTYGEWGDLFTMLAALLSLIMVSWRFKRDILRKRTKKGKGKDL